MVMCVSHGANHWVMRCEEKTIQAKRSRDSESERRFHRMSRDYCGVSSKKRFYVASFHFATVTDYRRSSNSLHKIYILMILLAMCGNVLVNIYTCTEIYPFDVDVFGKPPFMLSLSHPFTQASITSIQSLWNYFKGSFNEKKFIIVIQ